MFGQQRLVGGDEGFARPERRLGGGERDPLFAADQFHEKIDVRCLGQGHAIVEPGEAGEVDPPLLGPVGGRNAPDDDLSAGPARQRLGLPVEQFDDRRSDGAETGNADAQGRRHGCKAREPEEPMGRRKRPAASVFSARFSRSDQGADKMGAAWRPGAFNLATAPQWLKLRADRHIRKTPSGIRTHDLCRRRRSCKPQAWTYQIARAGGLRGDAPGRQAGRRGA